MIDLAAISANLELKSDGIWYASRHSPIDYPQEGNAFCYGLEEGSFWFNHRNAFILEALRRYPPDGVLFDVGGANGYVARAIQQSGIETVLIEPGFEGVKNAQRRGISYLVCATLEDARFESHTMPAVGIFDVLEHIENDNDFLAGLHRLLKPGGRLYITVPAYQFLWSIEDDFARHYRRYTLGHLKKLLAETGFSTEYSTYIFATLPIPILLLRTVPTKLGWRRPGDLKKTGAELNPGSSAANRFVNIILRWELRTLQNLKTLPFGGSCLVVAQSQ
jgi:hypothetical protein